MAEIGSAFVTIAPSAKGFGSNLSRQVDGETRSVGKSIGATFGKMFVLGAGVIAAAGIGSFLKGSIDEAREAQKVGAATSAIIKSTGSAAGITAGQVGKMATRLSNVTGIDDEAIQSGSNLLLTFKNVKNYVDGQFVGTFDRATASAVDLSAAGFGSIESASKTLGKALNDPVKGVSALSRAGVTFTDAQKEQIKSFVDTGQSAKAQNLILKEVESQVGGVAAATSTYGEKAGVAFGNIKEQVGSKLLPVIDSLAKTFLSQVPRITRIIDGIGPAFTRAKNFLTPFIAQVRGFFSGGQGGGFVAGLLSVVDTVRANFLPVLQTMSTTFTTTVLPAVRSFASYVLTSLVPVFQQIIGIITTRVLPIVASLAQFFYGTLYPAVVGIATAVAKNLKPVFDQLVATLQAKVLPAVDKLLAGVQRNLPTFQKIATVVVKVAGFLLKLAAAILAKVLPPLIRLAGFIIGRAVGAFSDLLDGITKVVNFLPKIAAFANGVKDKIGNAVDFIKRLPDRMTKPFNDLPAKMRAIGGFIIDGLVAGIKAAAAKVQAAVQSIIDKIPKFIRKRMGIASPSKVTAKLGAFITEGLAKGIESQGDKVTKALGKLLDKAKTQIEQRRDDFKSLVSSVGDNFAGNLFSGFETAGAFLTNLTTVKGNLGDLLSAFKTLKGYGISGGFLAKLFADGGAPLILDLAKDQGQATSAASLFSDIQSLSGSLGNTVAVNSDIGGGKTLADIEKALQKTNALLAKVPDGVGDKVNGAATGGKGKGNKGGKRGR